MDTDGERYYHNLMYDEDWSTFWGISPDIVYHIATDGCSSSEADTYLRLYDSNSNVLDSDDDEGPGLCSHISYQFSTGDAYYTQVTPYNDSYGCYTDYNIRMWSSEVESNDTISSANRLNENSSTHVSEFYSLVTGLISSSSDEDYFRVYGEAGKDICVDLIVPSGVDYDIKLEDLGGTEVASSANGGDSNESFCFTVPSAAYGPYIIHIYPYSGYSTSESYECYVDIE